MTQNEVLKLLDALLGYLDLQFASLWEATLHNVFHELALEEPEVAEEARLNEIEQTPELLQVVLHGRSW